MSQPPPLVVVTVLNHRGWDNAVECVVSVLASDYPNLRIIIVDNGSTDSSGQRLQQLTDDNRVRVLRSECNLGSVGGTNLSMKSALDLGAQYILTLSNDTTVASDLITALVALLEREPSVGVAAPRIMFHDRPDYIWSRGGYLDLWLARGRMPDENAPYISGDKRVLPATLLIGCVMFFRRELLETVGMLDERYFYQNEEYQFFNRVQKAGWQVRVLMSTYATHKHGQTIRPQSYDRWYYATRNRLLFIREDLGAAQRLTATLMFIATRVVKFSQWLLWGRIDLVRATFEGWRDYRARRLGPRMNSRAG